MSQDAAAASGPPGGTKRSASDDNLENMLSGALEQGAAEDVVGRTTVAEDVVGRYHEMMRRTLVDWGDEIFDLVAKRFTDAPKTVAQIELVRKETIDPLRPSGGSV